VLSLAAVVVVGSLRVAVGSFCVAGVTPSGLSATIGASLKTGIGGILP